MAALGRCFMNTLGLIRVAPVLPLVPCPAWLRHASPVFANVDVRHYASRPATRERKRKIAKANKQKKDARAAAQPVQVSGPRKKSQKVVDVKPKMLDDSWKSVCKDDVWVVRYHRWPVHSLKQAVLNFKESHHPTMYNMPKSVLKAHFELDLSTKKKTQFVEKVSDIFLPPHLFDERQPRSVCVLCKTNEDVDKALEAGATTAVGVQGVKMFQEGNLDEIDYEFILAHSDLIPDLVPIRGLLGQKYPRIKSGTLGDDIVGMVNRFRRGIEYSAQVGINNKGFGILESSVGMVDMTPEQVEENFRALIKSVMSFKPRNTDGSFIIKGMLMCSPSSEWFKLDLEPFVGKTRKNGDPDPELAVEAENDSDDETPMKAAQAAK